MLEEKIVEKDVEQFSTQCENIFKQISRDVIGQKEVVEHTIIAMIIKHLSRNTLNIQPGR